MADWSSLPSDLVDRIADRLLATNDVDCYMDFRAVCATWRSSTDDPKNSSELRFRPRRWIIIDEVFQSDSRLMVNTVSGRVVRKDLPLLRRFYVVATTHGGFFVLAEKKPPHAACVLNPFTGHLIQFMAPMLCVNDLSAAVIGSSPSIVLLSDKQSTFFGQHVADPDSECFKSLQEFKYQQDRYLMNRMAFRGGVYGKGEQEPAATFPVGVTRRLYHLVMLFPSLFPSMSLEDRCFIAEFSGQVFIIINLQHRSDDAGLEADSEVLVFKLDADSEVLEPVNSIGNLAIFVGSRRCFAVNAEKFPSIGASCIYYVKSTKHLLPAAELEGKSWADQAKK
jgi:hypothetical protein